MRRVAATLDLQRSLDRLTDEEIERLKLRQPMVSFSEPEIGNADAGMDPDAAALEDADEQVRLQFPDDPRPS